jgi:hypothetical protein
MRLIKSFLLLLVATVIAVAFLQVVHAFGGAGTAWQNLIHASSL